MTLLTRQTVVRSAKKISYNSLSAAIHLLMIQPYLYIRRRTRKLLWRINAIPNKWKACCFYGGYSIAQEDRCQWLPRAPEPHPQRVIVIHYVLFDIKVSFCFMELSSVRVCIKINYTIKYVHSYRYQVYDQGSSTYLFIIFSNKRPEEISLGIKNQMYTYYQKTMP